MSRIKNDHIGPMNGPAEHIMALTLANFSYTLGGKGVPTVTKLHTAFKWSFYLNDFLIENFCRIFLFYLPHLLFTQRHLPLRRLYFASASDATNT